MLYNFQYFGNLEYIQQYIAMIHIQTVPNLERLDLKFFDLTMVRKQSVENAWNFEFWSFLG